MPIGPRLASLTVRDGGTVPVKAVVSASAKLECMRLTWREVFVFVSWLVSSWRMG